MIRKLYIHKISYFFIAYLLLIVSCSNSLGDIESKDVLVISTEKEFIDFDESIDIVIESENNAPSKIQWYINEKPTSIYGKLYHFTSENNFENRYIIHAELIDGDKVLKSNSVSIFTTSYPSLIKTVYEFIDKYDIQTSLSVSVYNDKTDFTINTGLTSLVSKVPNSDQILHYLFSITKTFTCAETLKLINSGDLSFNQKVSDLIPEVDSLNINMNATVGELLSHTSGIFDYVENPALFSNNPYRTQLWDPSLLFEFIVAPKTESGFFSYSSANFLLLGLIIEKKIGKSLNEIIKENFLEKVTLSNVFLYPQDSVDLTKVSHPHIYPYTDLSLVGDGVTPIDLTTIIPDAIDLLGKSSWAAGGMVGKSNDVAKWGYHLYSRTSDIIDSQIKDQIYNSVSAFTAESPSPYGFGVRMLFNNDTSFMGTYGRSIGSENLMFYNSKKDTSYAILSSSNSNKDGKPNINDLLFDLQEKYSNE